MTSLDNLQCHFTWITDEELEGRDISKSIVENLDGDPDYEDVKVMEQPLVAFLKTREQDPDLDIALKAAETSIQSCRNPAMDENPFRLRGYELIALSNKAHIQEMQGDETGRDETLNEIQKLRDEDPKTEKVLDDENENPEEKHHDNSSTTEAKEKSKVDEASGKNKNKPACKQDIFNACIAGVHAYALYKLTLNQESLVLFRSAEDLDPNCYHWPMGRGVAAGRLQRRQKMMGEDDGILKQLDKEQEESLLQAMELTQNKNHIVLTRLADVYFLRGRGQPLDPSTKNKDVLKKAEKLLLQAYEINPNSSVLLKRLGKTLVEIDREKYESFAEECLLKAHEIDPTNSMTLHRLGQFYEYASDSLQDLSKAEEYYEMAINSGPTRNIAAESDLGRVRKKQDRTYDGIKHFQDMLKMYPAEDNQIIIRGRLEQMRQNQLNRRMRYLRF